MNPDLRNFSVKNCVLDSMNCGSSVNNSKYLPLTCCRIYSGSWRNL